MDVQTQSGTEPSLSPPGEMRSWPVASFLVLVLVNMMWAFQFSGAKIVTERLGPVSTALIPLALSTALFAPFLRAAGKGRGTNRFTRSLLGGLLMIGTLGIVPAQLGLTWGVKHSLASNASVITLTIPVLTAVMAVMLLQERMTALRWLSFGLAICGVLIVSEVDLRSADIFRSSYLAGNLLIFASCLGSAFNNTYSKRLLEILSPLELLVYSFLVSDIERSALGRMGSLGLSVWLSLLAIAVFSLSVSMMLYFWVIQRIDVTQASLSVYLLPVFGVLFSSLLLREKITPQLLLGGALVFTGTFLVTVQEERQKARLRDSQEPGGSVTEEAATGSHKTMRGHEV
jgi:drug/metabolite transporter (DMT)-like permease